MTQATLPEPVVRPTQQRDVPGIVAMTREVYPWSRPWSEAQLASHRAVFHEGQLVAVLAEEEKVVAMAASLIVTWDDYEIDLDWRDFTEHGTFANHDPSGGTLYGAEVMVRPGMQRRGIGRKLYAARRELVERLGLRRIRAGARLRGYHRWVDELSPEEYVRRVLEGEIDDPTLSFQLREGFEVLAVVRGYLAHDPESLGYAALIEWLNPAVATAEDHARRAQRAGRLPERPAEGR